MNGKIKKRLFSKDVFSLPNILSYFRILLIPVILICYLTFKNYWVSAGLIVLSGLTDVADGIIARKFNMVTDFGKFIDPVADKLTQSALIVCLVMNYIWAIILLVAMLIKDSLLFFWGLKVLEKEDALHSSRWFGKACTVFVYASIFTLFLAPVFAISDLVAYILLGACTIFVIISTILYGRYYYHVLSDE